MVNSHRLVVLTAAVALSAVALANDPDKSMTQGEDSPAVQKLKESLPSSSGFKVDSVRQGSDGVSCINYRVDSDMGLISGSMATPARFVRPASSNVSAARPCPVCGGRGLSRRIVPDLRVQPFQPETW